MTHRELSLCACFIFYFHMLAVACNVLQSVTMPLLLPHQLFGTSCRRRCGHPHRCSCSGVGSSLSFFGVPWAQDTPRDFILALTWPCSCLTLRHVKWIRLLLFILFYYYYYYYYFIWSTGRVQWTITWLTVIYEPVICGAACYYTVSNHYKLYRLSCDIKSFMGVIISSVDLHCVSKKACDTIYLSIIRILIARL